MDEVVEDVPPPPPAAKTPAAKTPAAKPPAAKPPAAKRSRGGGRAGGSGGKELKSLSQPTPAAKAMVEEEEDDFVMEHPQRKSASQVWRIRPLFEQF